MTKEEFKAKTKEYYEKCDELRQQINALRELHGFDKATYIDANKPCKIGDKVKVRNSIGIAVDFEVKGDDEVVPVLAKIKKNGSASQHKIFVWGSDTFEYPQL